jgi:hypothetical protein
MTDFSVVPPYNLVSFCEIFRSHLQGSGNIRAYVGTQAYLSDGKRPIEEYSNL